MQDAGFHVAYEQTHVLSPPTFQFSHQLINIMLLVDGIRTLVDVIIVDPIRLGFACCVILRGGQDSDGSNKGRIVLKFIPC
jgi:hypothetical protein